MSANKTTTPSTLIQPYLFFEDLASSAHVLAAEPQII